MSQPEELVAGAMATGIDLVRGDIVRIINRLVTCDAFAAARQIDQRGRDGYPLQVLREPFITDFVVEPLVLIEASASEDIDFSMVLDGYSEVAFLHSRSAVALSWWLPPDQAGPAQEQLETSVRQGLVLRVASNQAGISVGIERLDEWPELPGRIVRALTAEGAQLWALQTAIAGLRVVTDGSFVRLKDVNELVHSACYSSM